MDSTLFAREQERSHEVGFELKELAPIIGVWETTAKCRFSPDGPVVECRSNENVYWSRSGKFIISDQQGLSPAGLMHKLVVTAWDPINKNFQMIDITPGGESYVMVMSLEGNTAKITGNRIGKIHSARIWMTIVYDFPDKYRFRSECSVDEGPKWVFSEGTSFKVKPKDEERVPSDLSHL
jgi:hypothetical protein